MTDQEIYRKVSRELNIPIEKVIAYDKAQWNHIKQSLNNPTFDVLEVPMLCTWVIIPSRMRTTLKYSLRILRKTKQKLAQQPDNERLKTSYEENKRLFKNLWKLKKDCKMI